MNELGKAMFESTACVRNTTRTPTATSTPRRTSTASSTAPTARFVNLCLDTGHISYCGGDNLAIIKRAPERIGYLHLKQVDPEVRAKVEAEDLPFGEARQARRDDRTAARHPGHATAARRDRAARHRRVRDRRAGHVSRAMSTHPLPIAQRTRKYLGLVRCPVREIPRSPRRPCQICVLPCSASA